MYSDIDKTDIYKNSHLALSFEFFSRMKRKYLARKFAKGLVKEVAHTNEYDSQLPVTADRFKLEPDFARGFKTHRLTTGIMPYHEAVHIMLKAMNLINEYGWTDDKVGMEVALSLNSHDLELKRKVTNLNIFKFLLNLDEKKIFDLWPASYSKANKVYESDAALIYPKNYFDSEITLSLIETMNPVSFKIPRSRYMGIDFQNLPNNYITINYISGKNYQNIKKNAVGIVNHVVEKLYETLQHNNYTKEEIFKINKIIEKQKDIIRSTRSAQRLVENYNNINLYVDLSNDPRVIEGAYPKFRAKVFELIAYGNLKRGVLNFDSDTNKLQVKNGSIRKGIMLEDMEFFECLIEGEFENCLFENCKIRSSKLTESTVVSNNEARYTYFKDCPFIGEANEIRLSYFDNSPDMIINGSLYECIVRRGAVSIESEVDDNTEFVERRLKRS